MTRMPDDVFRALSRLMTEYTYAVDSRRDPENVVALFTDDAVIDFSAVAFPRMEGREQIHAFYAGLVENMANEFHIPANLRADGWDGEVGVITAYVMGMGVANDGTQVSVQVKYRMECVQVGDAWKCRHFSLEAMMPLPA
ncbi:nuclear transport factor 2 family protein [Croceicoccus ponticola]|uniref:Nuclear transport factor 2 family protein n=1 Tax=Croceicoccus ponticola TaxID=2217664 RepID=A0A437GWN3_9SPHN|nr:nuclear transport factor 2 family protein [Croceicoccus ponticola]RVQ66543.1 nuclear transport factor 2 family protein [Croceicoccus ponticola]